MVAIDFIIGKCSEIIRKTKRRGCFFAEKSAFAVPEPLTEFFAASEGESEEGAL